MGNGEWGVGSSELCDGKYRDNPDGAGFTGNRCGDYSENSPRQKQMRRMFLRLQIKQIKPRHLRLHQIKIIIKGIKRHKPFLRRKANAIQPGRRDRTPAPRTPR
jgi:hypothetical protein